MRWAKKWGEVESGWAKQAKEGGGCGEEKNHLAFAPPPSSLFFHTGSQLNLFPLHAFRNECLHCKLKQILWDGITNRPPKKKEILQVSQMSKTDENTKSLKEPQRSSPNPERGHCVVFFSQWLSTQVYKQVSVLVNLMLGVALQRTTTPSRGGGGEYKYSQSIHATETKLRPDGVLGSYADFTVIPNSSYLILWDKNTTFLIDLQEQDGNRVSYLTLCSTHLNWKKNWQLLLLT